ncbi:MAG: two-component regulator propeller domain-containing protein [Bacteroidota bacterium]
MATLTRIISLRLLEHYSLIGLLLFSWLELRSQEANNTLSLHHIPTGLSENSATQIFQDSKGFLWIGTPNGINKYDGTEFQIFTKGATDSTGLTDGYIESIYEDFENLLYVGTNQGLNLYDRALNVFKPYPLLPQGEIIQSKYIGAIIRSGDYLWLGTDNSGIYRYHIPSGETRQLLFDHINKVGPSNHFIVEIFPAPNDQLLVITQESIYLIDKSFNIISGNRDPLDLSNAIAVSEDEFWIGTHTGELIQVGIKNNELELKSQVISRGYTILSLAMDGNNNIWLGTENDGLWIYNTTNQERQHLKVDLRNPNSITSNSIWSLFSADNDVMWLGTFRQGLSFYDPDYYKFRHIRKDPFNVNSLSNDIINCFLEDESGNLWIGTDGGGLNYWDRENNSFNAYALSNGQLNSNVVLTMFKDDEDKLWIGTWAKGLAIFDLRTKRYDVWHEDNSFLGSNHVIGLLRDRKARIWIATLFGGLHLYNTSTKTHEHIRLQSSKDNNSVNTAARLLEDSNGHIWVGTQTSGVFRIEENDSGWDIQHYHSLDENHGISNDFVNTVIEDNDGLIWVGTQAGLNRYDPTADAFQFITKADGLKDDAIKGIIKDSEGFLWLSTSQGITRFNPGTRKSQNYDLADGLQSNQFNASSFFTTKTREFLFGGNNGFNLFITEEAKKRDDIPKIYFTSLKVFNQPVLAGDATGILKKDINQTDSITFSYKHSVIEFEFHALTYRHPDKVQYAYFLEGFENAWNYIGNNKTATYTNLNPGDYRLRIKSTNSDEVWHDQETTLWIRVTPPFWMTWWFRALTAVVVIGFAYSIYLIRIRNIKKYQTQLEIQIDQRTSELRQQKEKLSETADELYTNNQKLKELRANEKKLSEETIALKEREMATMAMSTHEKNTLLKDLEQKVTFLEMRIDEDMKPDLKDLKRTISGAYSMENSWDSFVQHFRDVHKCFFDRLKTESPHLTNYDLKLSAYLKVGMSNKEIAQVTNLTTGSVKVKVNRLKKKLEMKPEDNLRDFMIRYA